jgi:hypothetical protein
MIGACAKSFDWRTASPDAIGCEVDDITGKLTMCLHDRYFDAFGGRAGWIESVTAECREKLALERRGFWTQCWTEGRSMRLRWMYRKPCAPR